ncbi:MAG: lipopolysaccharide biosynthesis protein [Solirubrobacteraceae bacterium]|nr:MAG: hypothetical protein DLM63_13170 [Solirubrobacterales bacterium]
MIGYFRRLLRTGFAYQLGEALAKVVALGLLPVYTHFLTPRDYGTAEVLTTAVVLISIVLRLGIDAAFVRLHFLDAEPERRIRIARLATGFTALCSTVALLVALAFAGSVSQLILGYRDATLMSFAAMGLWAFTNLEVAYALLRVEERAREYLFASLTNVALTISLTVPLVVAARMGARGLILGNYTASTIVLLGLWWRLRNQLGFTPGRWHRPELGPMLRFGLPTMPADLSVYALNVVDRIYLYRHVSPADAGRYSLAVKLATAVTLAVRGFQYAWPPLAYSIESDEEASKLYARVTTWYVAVTGAVVVGLALVGRWVLRVFAAHSFFGAYRALPWVALGWALYGLFLVFVVIAGRARMTSRNLPAAAAGLLVNVVAIVLLVGPLGIAGAGLALCLAYVAILTVMRVLTRRLFHVAFEWRRLALLVVVLGGAWGAGDAFLPDDGVVGFVSRAGVIVAVPLVLWLAGFLDPGEREGLRRLVAAGRARARAQLTAAGRG